MSWSTEPAYGWLKKSKPKRKTMNAHQKEISTKVNSILGDDSTNTDKASVVNWYTHAMSRAMYADCKKNCIDYVDGEFVECESMKSCEVCAEYLKMVKLEEELRK